MSFVLTVHPGLMIATRDGRRGVFAIQKIRKHDFVLGVPLDAMIHVHYDVHSKFAPIIVPLYDEHRGAIGGV
jgi:hypothetical protein